MRTSKYSFNIIYVFASIAFSFTPTIVFTSIDKILFTEPRISDKPKKQKHSLQILKTLFCVTFSRCIPSNMTPAMVDSKKFPLWTYPTEEHYQHLERLS